MSVRKSVGYVCNSSKKSNKYFNFYEKKLIENIRNNSSDFKINDLMRKIATWRILGYTNAHVESLLMECSLYKIAELKMSCLCQQIPQM